MLFGEKKSFCILWSVQVVLVGVDKLIQDICNFGYMKLSCLLFGKLEEMIGS